MSLADVITAVMADFNSGRDPLVPTFLGEKFVRANATPPRVVWVPTSDAFGHAESEGWNPRPLGVRSAGASVYIQGRTLAETEGFLNDLLGALHRTVSRKNYVVNDADWLTGGELMSNGYEVNVSLTVRMPVTDRAAVLAGPVSRVVGAVSGATEAEVADTVDVRNRLELVSGDDQVGIHGEPLALPVVVRVTGPKGAVQGATVHFAPHDANGLVPDEATAVTDVNGLVSMPCTMSDSMRSQVLDVTWMPGDSELESVVQVTAVPVG